MNDQEETDIEDMVNAAEEAQIKQTEIEMSKEERLCKKERELKESGTYQMYSAGSHFKIKDGHEKDALTALKEYIRESGTEGIGLRKEAMQSDVFREAFAKCWWMTETDFPERVMFTGFYERDDEALLASIAPYVEEGSAVYMAGDCERTWVWYFDGQKMSRAVPDAKNGVYTFAAKGI